MACPDCGRPTGGDWRFCPDCMARRRGIVEKAVERVYDRLEAGECPPEEPTEGDP